MASRSRTDHCCVCEDGSTPRRPPIPSPRHRNCRTRRRDPSPLREGEPGTSSCQRCGPQHSLGVVGRSRRQPQTNEIRGVFRGAARHQPCPGLIRTDRTASSQPGRQPPSQQRSMADRYQPDTNRRRNQRLRHPTPSGGQKTNRDNPLPQTAHRPRNLPAHHQPATNPELRPPTHPATTRRHHRNPSRPSSRNPPQPHLSTRTRPQPQPPPRHPIPDLAPNPPTRRIIDLATIGASMSHQTTGRGSLGADLVRQPTVDGQANHSGQSREPTNHLLVMPSERSCGLPGLDGPRWDRSGPPPPPLRRSPSRCRKVRVRVRRRLPGR